MAAAMTFDEVSMERSKTFVNALQELKNLRPQLYSAAEYCEKSFLHSEQKQVVLDNLKDYTIRALVNAVDHLGTVAYKLNDLFEQHSEEVSSLDLKIYCLNQQMSTCQNYIDKEGLRQQQMCGTAPKLHKHYILPNLNDTKPRPYNTVKTLSWHLSTETSSASNGSTRTLQSSVEPKAHKILSDTFKLPGIEREKERVTIPRHLHYSNIGNKSPDVISQRTGGIKDGKQISAVRSFENPNLGRQIIRAPPRTKSMLSAFFVKNKSAKLKKISVI